MKINVPIDTIVKVILWNDRELIEIENKIRKNRIVSHIICQCCFPWTTKCDKGEKMTCPTSMGISAGKRNPALSQSSFPNNWPINKGAAKQLIIIGTVAIARYLVDLR